MAIGALPYRALRTASSTDANGTPTITVQVQDANGVNKGSPVTVFLGGLGDASDYRKSIEQAVTAQAVADAGSMSAFLSATVAAGNQTKEWFLGAPAFIPSVVPLNGLSVVTWTNMPSALTEVPGGRVAYDLTLVTQARLSVNVVVQGAASAVVGLQFSTDNGSTWNFLDGGTGPNVAINTTGLKTSAFVNLTANAKADVLVRFGGQGGDGVADPQFGLALLQLR